MTKFKSLVQKSDKGFTLIELMIVIAIIGILAAIAIPQFSAYRVRSYNAGAMADLRNAATAQEAYFVDEGRYYSVAAGTKLIDDYGVNLTGGVALTVISGSTDADMYKMTTVHSSGDRTYTITGPGGDLTNVVN